MKVSPPVVARVPVHRSAHAVTRERDGKAGNFFKLHGIHSATRSGADRLLLSASQPVVRRILRAVLPAEGVCAERLLRESLRIHRKNEPQHWETAKTASLLGQALTGLKRYDEAEPLLIESYPIIKENRRPEHLRTREALERIVGLYEAWGKPEKAARYRAD